MEEINIGKDENPVDKEEEPIEDGEFGYDVEKEVVAANVEVIFID